MNYVRPCHLWKRETKSLRKSRTQLGIDPKPTDYWSGAHTCTTKPLGALGRGAKDMPFIGLSQVQLIHSLSLCGDPL